jgi:DNA-directed RNA polymerase specialized sigma24 family protein
MTLCACLMLLAALDTPTRERNDAARRLYTLLGDWVPRLVKGIAPCRLSDDDAMDVLSHVLDKACLGGARFRGTTEGEAHAWVKRIVANKSIDLCRARRGMTSDEGELERIPDSHDVADPGPLRAAVEEVREALGRMHRPNDAKTLARAFECHLEARVGAADIDDQIERYGYDGPHATEPRDEASKLRARNRVYQYRKRGREAGCRALRSLAESGRYGAEEAREIARFLGCKAGDDDDGQGKKEAVS